jgi:hypothetical protein
MRERKVFLQKLVGALNLAGIPYMLSASIGSSFHGRPRATNDIDIVVAPTQAQLDGLLLSLGQDFYVSEDAARDVLSRRASFNVIDVKMAWKADIIVRRDRPFSTTEFGRRQKVNVLGLDVWIVSPEDAILSKLEWAGDSHSEQQLRDALGVLAVQYDNLDQDYLRKWAKELNGQDLLEKLLAQAKRHTNRE